MAKLGFVCRARTLRNLKPHNRALPLSARALRGCINAVLMALVLTAGVALGIGQPAFAASCADTNIRCVGPGQAYASIQAAANAAQAGDTVIVSAGTYNEKVSTVRSGTANARITFKAEGDVVIKSFNHVDHDYITIDGFEMTGANAGYMIRWNGDHGQLLNNVMHDTGSSWIIVNSQGNNFYAAGNHYYSSTGPGSDLSVFSIGGNNSLVENNEIGPAKDIDAFRVWGHDNVIRGNYIHDVTNSPGGSAHKDVIQTFGVNGGESYNIVFEDNLIDNTNGDNFQMMMTENNNDPDYHDWDVRNNIYIGVGGQANVGIPDLRFYNNTVYDGGESNRLIMYLYDASGKGDHSGAEIKNNIFIPADNIDSYGQIMAIGSSGSNVQVSNNYVAKIGSWAPLSNFSDTNGINGGDPKFANVGAKDFRLLSTSPAIDRGITLAGVVDDKDGISRPQGSAYDMGAYEYHSGGSTGDTIAPTITLTAPANGTTLNDSTTILADASDNVGVVGVQFKLDGANLGAEDTTNDYTVAWDTTAVADGTYTLTAVARDAAGNTTTSAPHTVTVDNAPPDTTAPSTKRM